MSKNLQRWLRSPQGLMSVIGAIVLILALGLAGQLAGWWNLVPGAGTVLPPAAPAWGAPGGGYSCLPTCDETDGKFFVVAGSGLRTFAAEPIITWIGVPETQSSVEIGVFDGDTGKDNNGNLNIYLTNWDQGTTESIYTLYADPLRNGSTSTILGIWRGNTDNMPNNSWFDISINNSPQAQAPSGHYFYRLEIEVSDYQPVSANGFKLRTSGYLSAGMADRVDSVIGLTGMLVWYPDIAIIYPEFQGNINNPGPSTYTGEWLFNVYVPNDVQHLEFWDGDFDHGSWNGSTLDIDDLVTGTGYIPEWAASPSVLPQGAQGIGAPPDENRLPIYARQPSVIYSVIDPNGEPIHVNNNPSGTEEWQRFVISTDPGAVARNEAHFNIDRIQPGVYGWHIQGLDMHNYVWIRTIYEIVGECADGTVCVPPPEWHEGTCPRTIGYWKNNVQKVLIQNRTVGVQESRATLEWGLDNVALASPLFRNGINTTRPVAIGSVARLTNQEANTILQRQNDNSMMARALQQNLATWLNLGTGKLGPTTVVVLNVAGGTFEGTVMQALEEAQAIILNPNSSNAQLERAKDLADQMNNGLLGEDAETSTCSDYVQVIPPGKQPPPRDEMPEAPVPDMPDDYEPEPAPDPTTCPNLRVNQYNVENTTNSPFYGIKFEYQSGTEIRDGNFDEFKLVVTAAQAAQMNDTGIQVEAKAGTMQGEALLSTCQFDQALPCSEIVKDSGNQFAFYFLGAVDNGDGTLTLTFQVQNLTNQALSHATIGLPSGVTPSSPTDSYESKVCQ
jgi:hypothetical protein